MTGLLEKLRACAESWRIGNLESHKPDVTAWSALADYIETANHHHAAIAQILSQGHRDSADKQAMAKARQFFGGESEPAREIGAAECKASKWTSVFSDGDELVACNDHGFLSDAQHSHYRVGLGRTSWSDNTITAVTDTHGEAITPTQDQTTQASGGQGGECLATARDHTDRRLLGCTLPQDGHETHMQGYAAWTDADCGAVVALTTSTGEPIGAGVAGTDGAGGLLYDDTGRAFDIRAEDEEAPNVSNFPAPVAEIGVDPEPVKPAECLATAKRSAHGNARACNTHGAWDEYDHAHNDGHSVSAWNDEEPNAFTNAAGDPISHGAEIPATVGELVAGKEIPLKLGDIWIDFQDSIKSLWGDVLIIQHQLVKYPLVSMVHADAPLTTVGDFSKALRVYGTVIVFSEPYNSPAYQAAFGLTPEPVKTPQQWRDGCTNTVYNDVENLSCNYGDGVECDLKCCENCQAERDQPGFGS